MKAIGADPWVLATAVMLAIAVGAALSENPVKPALSTAAK